VAERWTGLAAGTQQTNDGVAEAQRSAAELARMSDELQDAVPSITRPGGPADTEGVSTSRRSTVGTGPS
jgi:hypothetical protein